MKDAFKEYPEQAGGYVFYTMQDEDTLLSDSGLHLSYGHGVIAADADKEAATLEVGQRVARVMRERGLAVDWNGDIRERIYVRLPDAVAANI